MEKLNITTLGYGQEINMHNRHNSSFFDMLVFWQYIIYWETNYPYSNCRRIEMYLKPTLERRWKD